MTKDSDRKSSLGAPIAALCGLFTAFGCGYLLSEPETDFVAEIPSEPEVIPTAYQSVQTGQISPAQNSKKPPLPVRLGPPPEIVIKLKDKDEADRICDMFWKDEEAGRKEFDKAFKNKPELANLRLKRVTYSNEFVVDIIPTLDKPPSDIKPLYAKAVKHLSKLPNVAYAEPNATAQPGKSND
ncbi:hypothetical protein [Hirschia maritima]|uniref:hypothetical protein n=1 Tax=Hirschia maritima TaxID=1121961 RepID=UPI00036D15BD|nr:hypothetical protein [Hirschia maritima]